MVNPFKKAKEILTVTSNLSNLIHFLMSIKIMIKVELVISKGTGTPLLLAPIHN